jgi:hypothetical protein
LFPPNPNALTAATRGPFDGHASSAASRRNGESRSASIGASVPIIGGRRPAANAPNTLIIAATPATVTRCPRFDLSDPIGSSSHPANTSIIDRTSVASPTGVPVAWHSISDTSEGRRSAASYASRIARTCPASSGARNPRPLPSFDSPIPRITPSTRSPAARASASRLSATIPAPSAGTSPSASLLNGRHRPVLLIAASAENPACRISGSAALIAPASIRSADPSCSRSHASLIA